MEQSLEDKKKGKSTKVGDETSRIRMKKTLHKHLTDLMNAMGKKMTLNELVEILYDDFIKHGDTNKRWTLNKPTQSSNVTIYRPQAFFKGLIFPLCQEKDVTLKEATIIASILHKVSIPSKHSAVALYKLSTMEYNSTQALFLKTLLDKKYSLPYAALDAVANYYIGFIDKKVDTPLLWHQGLLVFVQRYSKDFKPQQVQQLLRLCQVHRHHAITPLVIVQLQKQKD
ncbi:hypothetical protein CL6EHI_174260 [Entamoeba histolytica]|uniref:Bystin n=2 Tax=Entamoeba histolytica TaxID=5759 RepID=B1N3G3_ENTH1|nr:hypothetical protein EHI_174260 [Entamoeba histolytica HM-1:IMSS]EDS89496.1 hypothetical protein EHI_174260 [Entamoeba histolytica HM-1:IMSS]GAT95365.1 hypothetical protein CL6EHI_174260 [Entamoeba histolytica]|eukprot:XP_001913729.1 hypothetical protein EHI_174260 [Entamoeba histolytica HM-1:IMSS]